MNREEYAFAYNINGTRMSGIITMTNPPKLVCYCDEENSKTILKALNPPLPPAEGAEEIIKLIDELTSEIQDEYFHDDDVSGGYIESPGAGWVHVLCIMYDKVAALQNKPQPTAEAAEEILESIVESLGEPINIHNHIFEIRPYTVEHKTEWWIFHKEMGSGEPLAQWLQNFATLHAQRIAEKMVEEKLKNAPKNCPKAAQCAHVEGGMKCPPNVICPI